MAERANGTVRLTKTALQQLATETAGNFNYSLCVTMETPHNSVAESKIFQAFGSMILSYDIVGDRAIFHLPCVHEENNALSIDFYSCVFCGKEWADSIIYGLSDQEGGLL